MSRQFYKLQWRARLRALLEAQSMVGDGLEILEKSNNPFEESDPIEDLFQELLEANACRYISRPVTYAKNSRVHNVLDRLDGFSDVKCRTFLRMTRKSFLKLTWRLYTDEVFESRGYKQQEEAAVQIAILLDRLGHDGNGMASTRLAETWHRGEGSMYNYTARATKALLSLQDEYLSWPIAEERQEHATCAKIAGKGFVGCVGFVDGTTVPFEQRPEAQGDFYYDRHGKYSLNVQVVCDIDKRITFLYLGYSGKYTASSCDERFHEKTLTYLNCVGRCHDYFVFCKSGLWTQQHLFFDEGQYLLADSAYPISTVTVPVIKGQAGLTPDGRDFNRCVANLRACNEHCIGMLKGRWRSLKQLPVRIHARSEAADIRRALDWITVCAILHNFLVGEREILHEGICTPHRGTRPAGGAVDMDMQPTAEELAIGEAFRNYVQQGALEVARARGGFLNQNNH
ncbi:nuclease HARBI1 [Entomortierella parvispora]|uniref:Nuclease HARBI1 n=1 Tax=Entomortierella parvispora TaxID=205924 RepID=A0A9P3HDY6_9FUNG|nr:nuclease HARBI1 [Entomortierella parvispora]